MLKGTRRGLLQPRLQAQRVQTSIPIGFLFAVDSIANGVAVQICGGQSSKLLAAGRWVFGECVPKATGGKHLPLANTFSGIRLWNALLDLKREMH